MNAASSSGAVACSESPKSDDSMAASEAALAAPERRAAHRAAVEKLPIAASFSQFTDRRRPAPPAADAPDASLRASDVVNRCGAVLGYRACAAVPALVEFCVAEKKPFCVLPCCCFDVNGRPCASTAQMTDILAEFHPSIKKTVVDGAGTVLYSTFGKPWR